MKQKTRFKFASVFAGLACCAALPPALAQSNVTIYGRLNETVERQTAGGATNTLLQNNSSRIGFKGAEDLGGGLKAGFQLESGFSPVSGAANSTFWGRQSEVNLGGGFGTVRLGNFTSEAYYATADYVSMHNHDTGTSSDALYAYVSRNPSKLAYRTPSFGGASVELARTFRVPAAGTTPAVEPTYDLAANYANGPLQLGAGYAKDGDSHQFAVRALYELGAFVVGGYVQRDENNFAAGRRTNVRLSGMYSIDNTEFHVNVGKAGKNGAVADSEADQFTLGVNYKLSKRTKLYGFYTRLNDGAAGLYGGDFSSLALGIRHNF
ncbi:porin [Piscinibacter sp.]|jgi:predicted porin|uniref:porin n=1 Tax=Piscinibacter sp. TaxID=1903157 RepID=UPI002F3F1C2A